MPLLAEAGWLPQMRGCQMGIKEWSFVQKAETRSTLVGRAAPAGIGM
jgi:hypothetical protein